MERFESAILAHGAKCPVQGKHLFAASFLPESLHWRSLVDTATAPRVRCLFFIEMAQVAAANGNAPVLPVSETGVQTSTLSGKSGSPCW